MGGGATIGLLVLTSYTDGTPTTSGTSGTSETPTHTDGNAPQTHTVQEIRVPQLPDRMVFAGEEIPMTAFDIRERIDRELLSNCFRHSNTIGVIKRANRFFPIIEAILKKNDIPDDFKYLAVIESELMDLVSPAGASGVWQFMKETAGGYNLEVNDEVDERYHLEKATEAACQYLKKAKAEFGDWLLAAASYNMGGGGLKKDMESQKMTEYFDLHLNRETARYVPRMLATKEVMEHPDRYGFLIRPEDLYPKMPDFNYVKVTGAVASWADFAKEQGISYRTLKLYNAWIRGTKLTNKYGKTYEVKIPIGEK